MNAYDEMMSDIKIIHCESLHPVGMNKALPFWNVLNSAVYNGWKNHRIWIVTEGHAEVNTTYGKIYLEPNTAYYFENLSILFTNPTDDFKHLYLDFNINMSNNKHSQHLNFEHSSKDIAFIIPLLNKIEDNFKLSTILSDCICRNALRLILSCFISNDPSRHDSLKIFTPVLKYIQENAYDMVPISTKHLASLIGYSTEHFCRLFKETFGMTPKNYIIGLKLAHAQHLLLNTHTPISQISDMCGFESQPYFTKLFKNKLSITPSSYRAINKNNYR